MQGDKELPRVLRTERGCIPRKGMLCTLGKRPGWQVGALGFGTFTEAFLEVVSFYFSFQSTKSRERPVEETETMLILVFRAIIS